jgi:PEGA domain
MHLSRRPCLYASFALVFALCPARSPAETLTLTSSPAGATVEIDGLAAGATPYTTSFPGGYFHKTHTAFGERLEHSMSVRISKDGYLAQQITITSGPFEWVAITGRQRGNYFLLKARRFDVKLEPVSSGGRASETASRDGPMSPPSVASADFRPSSHEPASESASDSGPETGSVAISSDPPNADVYIDGEFVGETPSTVRLPSGKHRIEIRSAGKQLWWRNLDVLGESQLSLHASLEASP